MKLKINLSNRAKYSFIVLTILILSGVGVYAFADVSHTIDQIKFPGCNAENQLLKWTGTQWICERINFQDTKLTEEQVKLWANEVDDDTFNGLICSANQTVKKTKDNMAWECVSEHSFGGNCHWIESSICGEGESAIGYAQYLSQTLCCGDRAKNCTARNYPVNSYCSTEGSACSGILRVGIKKCISLSVNANCLITSRETNCGSCAVLCSATSESKDRYDFFVGDTQNIELATALAEMTEALNEAQTAAEAVARAAADANAEAEMDAALAEVVAKQNEAQTAIETAVRAATEAEMEAVLAEINQALNEAQTAAEAVARAAADANAEAEMDAALAEVVAKQNEAQTAAEALAKGSESTPETTPDYAEDFSGAPVESTPEMSDSDAMAESIAEAEAEIEADNKQALENLHLGDITSPDPDPGTTHDSGDIDIGDPSDFTGEVGDGTDDGDGEFGCFTYDQLVLTPNGYKMISKLKEGDLVISYDELKNKFTTSRIDKLIIHEEFSFLENNYNIYPLIKLGIKINGKIIYTKVTENHRYYNPIIKKYKQIGDFNLGDTVLSINGEGKIVSKEILINSKSTKLEKHTRLYNLHLIDGPHNYIVNQVVVHNIK